MYLTRSHNTKITAQQVAAFLALILAACVYCLMTGFGVPERIAIGATILCMIVAACFWTLLDLGPYDSGDDDE